MLSSLFINKSVLIFLLVIINEIKNVYTQDGAESGDKIATFRKLFESLATNTSSKVPCYLLSSPMDRIKSALKDLEIYNELYCTKNPNPQPAIMKAASPVDTQVVEDAEASTEYSSTPENINQDSQLGGQRTMYYPSSYNRWINPPNSYPNNFVYPYNDPSYQSAAYFYPNRMPYVHIYPVSSPSSQPPPQVPPIIAESFNDITTELTAGSSSTTILGESAIRKNKKNDRRCLKKKSSKKMESVQKKDENEDNSSSNDNSDANNNDSSGSN